MGEFTKKFKIYRKSFNMPIFQEKITWKIVNLNRKRQIEGYIDSAMAGFDGDFIRPQTPASLQILEFGCDDDAVDLGRLKVQD